MKHGYDYDYDYNSPADSDSTSRRDFLKTSLLSGAAAPLSNEVLRKSLREVESESAGEL
jgi:hypothetical protein